MGEEHLVALAQIVQAALSLWSARKTLFGTASITGKAIVAFHAVLGQRIFLVVAKFLL